MPNNYHAQKRLKGNFSPSEMNYHRKVTLKDADIDKDTKKQLATLCNDYIDIFSKYTMEIAKLS